MSQPMNGRNLLYRNAAFLYLMTAAKFILPVFATAVLARRLAPSGYGVIAFEMAVMNYFVLLFDYGFNYSATKNISLCRDNAKYVQAVISRVMTAKCILVLIGIFALAIFVVLVPMLREYWQLSFVYYLSTALNIFLPDFVYRGLEKMSYITIRYVIGKGLALGMIFLTVWSQDDLLLVPISYGIGTFVSSFYAFRHLSRREGLRLSFSPIGESFNELKEGFSYFLTLIMTTALTAFNALFMGILGMDAAIIANWTIALQIVTALQALNDPITTSLFPHVAKNRDYGFVLRSLLPICAFVCVGVALSYVLSDQLVLVLAGPGYEGASEIFRILVFLVLFSFPAQIIGLPLLGALGCQNQVTVSTCVVAVFHMILSIALVPLGAFSLCSLCYVRVFSELLLLGIRSYFVFRFIQSEKQHAGVKEM